CSTPARLSVKVLVGVTVNVSPGFFLSVITILVLVRLGSDEAIRNSGRPVHPLGNIREFASAREMSQLPAQPAALHVPHLGGPMPNPIDPQQRTPRFLPGPPLHRAAAAPLRACGILRRPHPGPGAGQPLRAGRWPPRPGQTR